MKNPFCISFGRKPVEYIDRIPERERIINTFTLDPITDQMFLITGVRGVGKTVLMNAAAHSLEEQDEWIVLWESSAEDINESIYSDLYHKLRRGSMGIGQMSVSFGGANVSVERKSPQENTVSQIDELLEKADKKKKKVLVVIDEVTNTPQMRSFAHMFQIECARNRPIFFLGTGLYENIEALSDENDLTFLHRAPRIVLNPLDNISVARSYQNIFGISEEKARDMAMLVKGYSFAFQALGYLYWENGKPDDLSEILPAYDAMLSDASYSKIWSECSGKDQEVLKAMAITSSEYVSDIRENCGNMTPNYFSVYRARLMKRGIITSSARRMIRFSLPRFREFVKNCILFSEM